MGSEAAFGGPEGVWSPLLYNIKNYMINLSRTVPVTKACDNATPCALTKDTSDRPIVVVWTAMSCLVRRDALNVCIIDRTIDVCGLVGRPICFSPREVGVLAFVHETIRARMHTMDTVYYLRKLGDWLPKNGSPTKKANAENACFTSTTV